MPSEWIYAFSSGDEQVVIMWAPKYDANCITMEPNEEAPFNTKTETRARLFTFAIIVSSMAKALCQL